MPTAFSGVHVRAGIVLGRDEAMTRIDRRRHRRAEIDVAETEHEIARVEHDALHVLDRIETVDAADELDVRRAPRRVGPHDCMYLSIASAPPDRSTTAADARCGTVPRCRSGRRASSSISRKLREQVLERQRRAVVVDLQRADAGREVEDAGELALLERPSSAHATRKRSAKSSTIGPYSTSM